MREQFQMEAYNSNIPARISHSCHVRYTQRKACGTFPFILLPIHTGIYYHDFLFAVYGMPATKIQNTPHFWVFILREEDV